VSEHAVSSAASSISSVVGSSSGSAADKTTVLVEALPYIRRFWGQVVVVKYGGHAFRPTTAGRDGVAGASSETSLAEVDEGGVQALSSFAEDIVLMRSVGMLPVVVHGGGPQIGALLARMGKTTEFRDGMRVTDAETLEIARMVLVGKVNREIVSAVNVHGALAVGLSGEDANLIRATARSEELGFVGDIEVVAPEILQRLLAQGLIPVVATIGADAAGQAYNINADAVAGAVAEALGANKLVFLTDVSGLRARREDPDSLLRSVSADELEHMRLAGAATEGMAPKADACVRAVRGGVARAHILDGRVPHALLLEIFTDEGVGTMISLDPGAESGDR
jgi:acetylglutamate kinase